MLEEINPDDLVIEVDE